MKANNLAAILSISFLTGGCSSPPKDEPVQPVPSLLQSQVEDLRASAHTAHLPSTPLRQPTVESDAPIGLPFTIDTLLAKNPGLKPIESLGEFKTSQKFSSDFVDGSGAVTGEFTKKTRKLQHVSLIGEGQVWTKTVEEIVLLTFNDSDKCNKILEGLSANPSDASVSIDGLRFQLSIMADRHLLQLTNENDAVKTQTELASDYVTPTVDVTISNFKKNFNRRMAHVNPKLQIHGNGEETTSPAYFAFNFSDDTALNLYADEKTMVI